MIFIRTLFLFCSLFHFEPFFCHFELSREICLLYLAEQLEVTDATIRGDLRIMEGGTFFGEIIEVHRLYMTWS